MARDTVYPKPLAGPEMWSLVESLVKGSFNSYKDKNHIHKNRITESEYQDLKDNVILERTFATSFIQKRQMSICLYAYCFLRH